MVSTVGIKSRAKTTGRQESQHRAETAIPDDQSFAIRLFVLCKHGFVGQPVSRLASPMGQRQFGNPYEPADSPAKGASAMPAGMGNQKKPKAEDSRSGLSALEPGVELANLIAFFNQSQTAGRQTF